MEGRLSCLLFHYQREHFLSKEDYQLIYRTIIEQQGLGTIRCCLFALVVIAVYSHTLTAPWHLDDFPNIVQNQALHILSLDSQSLVQTFFAHPLGTGQLFRPVSNLSFALNWYLGQDNVFGYHFVNILLHCGNAFFLYRIILILLATPCQRPRQNNARHLIALLATALWTLNPVQTQAITYIVQRMAVLSTFFTLAALFCYLLGRHAKNKKPQFFWFLGALSCFGLALGSKENGIILPAILLLVEWIFFRSLRRPLRQQVLLGASLLCLAGAAVYLLTNGNPLGSISGYEQRSFTLEQRLLTESRILVFYLSQLFYPAPWRLSLDHDISLSSSLLQPPTTLVSVLLLTTLLLWALRHHKSSPLAAFAILFFLLNHVIESTIFPLELIFEHRNYLPSLFLFLPVATLIVDALNNKRLQALPIARQALVGAVLLVLCSLMLATFVRNNVWRTEQSLWEDSLAKAPGQSRPYINLAHTYQKTGRNDEAFELCRQSLTKDSPTPSKDRMRAYNNMGNIAMDRGQYTEAIGYYRNALQAHEMPHSHYFLHKAFLADGQAEEAGNVLKALMRDHPEDIELMTSKALVLAAKQQLPGAAVMLQKALAKAPEQSYLRATAQICLGSVFSRQGLYSEADAQFREALAYSEPRIPILCVIGSHLRQGNREAALDQLAELRKHFAGEDLVRLLQTSTRQNILFPVEPKDLVAFIHSSPVPAPATSGIVP